MRLLLDEMISWRIAAELRKLWHDVVSVSRDRPALRQQLDRTVLEAASAVRRAVVTNSVRDYRAEHERMRRPGQHHHGVVFTYDDTLPRTKATVPLWVSRPQELLEAH